MWYLALSAILVGCSQQPTPEPTTTEGYKDLARKEIYRDCMRNTQSYGYPVEASDWGRLRQIGLDVQPDPATHCRTVARNKVK